MTKLLEKAFQEAQKLPETEHDALAARLLEELESDRRWDELFSRPESKRSLETLADEIRAEIKAGRTSPLDPDRILSRL
jgi:DNA phosphorothioation-dependent restriction protein DptG